jgi:hypothetical protein
MGPPINRDPKYRFDTKKEDIRKDVGKNVERDATPTPRATSYATAPSTMWGMAAHDKFIPKVEPLAGVYHRIVVPGTPGAQHNPSVVQTGDGLVVSVRSLYNGRTTNFLAHVQADWGLTDTLRIGELNAKGQHQLQLEDLRLFVGTDERLQAVACLQDGMTIRQTLLEFGENGSIARSTPQPARKFEKNWMPVIQEGQLRLVYCVDPLVVLELDSETQVTLPGDAMHRSGIRGGSQLVSWREGGEEWIALVHEVYRPPQVRPDFNPLLGFHPPAIKDPIAGSAPIVYLHRFAVFNSDLTAVKVGRPFYFRKLGIEFAAGLAWWNDRLVASFGLADNEAWLVEIEPKTVEALL